MKLEYFCFECGSTDNIEHHHVVPKVLGGTKTVPLCIKCHSLVHQKDFTKFRKLAKKGIEKARARGVKFGRTKGSKESTEKFLSKEKNQQVKQMLEEGYTWVEIKEETGCSNGTISKVSKLANIDTTNKVRPKDLEKAILRKQKRVKKSLEELQANMDTLRELEQSIKSDSNQLEVGKHS
jgi:hypothetical protein